MHPDQKRSVVRFLTQKQKFRNKKAFRTLLHEPLEDRRLMAVASNPDQSLPFNSTSDNVLFKSVRLDAGAGSDLVAVQRSGTIRTADNADTNAWRTTATFQPLGANQTFLAAASGLLSGGSNPDPFEDFVIQTPTHFEVLRNTGNTNWSPTQSIPHTGTTNSSTYPGTQPISAQLGPDTLLDFVFPMAESSQVAILRGQTNGQLTAPEYLDTGLSNPTHVVAANLLGGPSIDLAVGYADGTLRFFEGQTNGAFVLRNDLTLVSPLSSLKSIKASDVDGDGVSELFVVGGNQAIQLRSAADPLAQSPIRNGNFDEGLVGWTVQTVGHQRTQVSGNINALSGVARFTENESFLTSLKQTFVVPPNPQSIQFDLIDLGLEAMANGSVPDAFEVSLLNSANQSLVATHSSKSTAFANFAPGGTLSAASGVSRNENRITLDISNLTPGTSANLVFDLIGNPVGSFLSGTRSTVAVDGVRITPETIRNDGFIATPLPGPFADAQDIAIADVDGDQRVDIVITDLGLNQILVLNGLAPTTAIPIAWTRDPIALPGGFEPNRIAIGSLTVPDSIADIAVLSSSAATVRSPLAADTTVPTVQLVSPASSVTLGATESAASVFGTISLQFSEGMFLDTSSTPGSINNIAAYRVYHLGSNNLDEGGSGDDVLFTVNGVTYDAATQRVQLQLDSAALSNATIAAGSLYKVVVAGANPTTAVRDIAGNRLNGGQDFAATVAVKRTPELAPVPDATLDEGGVLAIETLLTHYSLNRSFDAIVQWGDSTSMTLSGNDSFPIESFAASHTYPDQGEYTVLLRIMEGNIEVARTTSVVRVRNVAPLISPPTSVASAEGQSVPFSFTVTDPGLNDPVTAVVEWGDGTTSSVPLSSQLGSARTFTTSHVFPDNAIYNVQIRVADEVGSTTATLAANVSSVAPSFNVGSQSAVAGIPFSLSPVLISDPGFSLPSRPSPSRTTMVR